MVDLPAGRALTRKQKRELGILPVQVLRYLKQMQAEGVDLRNAGIEELCTGVCGLAMEAEPAAWAPSASIDWDAIIAFLEKLIPLIIQLITIFGGL